MEDAISLLTPVLNLIDPDGGAYDRDILGEHFPSPACFLVRCQTSLEQLRIYVRGAACAAAGHALALVQSIYPRVELARIDTGFARGTTEGEMERLSNEASDSAIKIDEDLDLFGDASLAAPQKGICN